MTRPGPAERLRDEIDHGRSSDKTSFSDPAAAPLGTDDEAAGMSPTEEQVEIARRQEVGDRPNDAPSAGRPHDIGSLQSDTGPWRKIAIAAVVVVIVIALAFSL